MSEVEHILQVQSEAGESPHWNADEQALGDQFPIGRRDAPSRIDR